MKVCELLPRSRLLVSVSETTKNSRRAFASAFRLACTLPAAFPPAAELALLPDDVRETSYYKAAKLPCREDFSLPMPFF